MYGANEACTAVVQQYLAVVGRRRHLFRERTYFSDTYFWEVNWNSRPTFDAATFLISG